MPILSLFLLVCFFFFIYPLFFFLPVPSFPQVNFTCPADHTFPDLNSTLTVTCEEEGQWSPVSAGYLTCRIRESPRSLQFLSHPVPSPSHSLMRQIPSMSTPQVPQKSPQCPMPYTSSYLTPSPSSYPVSRSHSHPVSSTHLSFLELCPSPSVPLLAFSYSF